MTRPPEWNPGYQPGPQWTGGPGSGRGPGNNNTVIGAIVVVTVVIVAALGVYAFSGHKAQANADSSTTATTSSTPSTSLAPTSTTSPSPPTTTPPSIPATTMPSTTPNSFDTCSSTTANFDLINVTSVLSFSTSYDTASDYSKTMIRSCTAPSFLPKLRSYWGTVFGTSFSDLSGNNDAGPTDVYRVQVANTKRFVTFTMKKKPKRPGFTLIKISG